MQVNSHFAAFFKIYKIYTLLHRSELKSLEKIVQNFQKFIKIYKNKPALRGKGRSTLRLGYAVIDGIPFAEDRSHMFAKLLAHGGLW